MFAEALTPVVERIEGIRVVMLVGSDGMIVATAGGEKGDLAETLAATYADLKRRVDAAHADCGFAPAVEWISGMGEAWIVLRQVTDAFYLIALAGPDATLGRVRFELRRAASALESELAD